MIPQKFRYLIYRLAVVGFGVLVTKGVLSEESVSDLTQALGALLGFGLAAYNTPRADAPADVEDDG